MYCYSVLIDEVMESEKFDMPKATRQDCSKALEKIWQCFLLNHSYKLHTWVCTCSLYVVYTRSIWFMQFILESYKMHQIRVSLRPPNVSVCDFSHRFHLLYLLSFLLLLFFFLELDVIKDIKPLASPNSQIWLRKRNTRGDCRLAGTMTSWRRA